MESALACVVYEPAVDVSKISLNDFLVIYGPVLHKAFPDANDASSIKKMTEEAIDLYKTLAGDKQADKPTDTSKAMLTEVERIGELGVSAEQDIGTDLDLEAGLDVVLAHTLPRMLVSKPVVSAVQ